MIGAPIRPQASAGPGQVRTTPFLPGLRALLDLVWFPNWTALLTTLPADAGCGSVPRPHPEEAARKSLGGQRAPAGARSRGLACPSRNSRRGDRHRSGLRLPKLATPGWLFRGLFATPPKARGEAKVAPACRVFRIASCQDSALRRSERYAIVPRKALWCGCRGIERV